MAPGHPDVTSPAAARTSAIKKHHVFVGGKDREGVQSRGIERNQVVRGAPGSVGGFACREPQIISSSPGAIRGEVHGQFIAREDRVRVVVVGTVNRWSDIDGCGPVAIYLRALR